LRLKKYILSFFLICSLLLNYEAEGQSVRKYVNEFLNIGFSPRGIAMANSVTSSTNEAASMFYNPAGLTRIKNNLEASFMHTEYFAGVSSFDVASLAIKLNTYSVLGFGFVRFGTDNIPNTYDLIGKDGQIDYSRIKSFSAADYAFMVSYGQCQNLKGLRYRKEPIRYGGTLKIINRQVGPFATAWGFGVDAGLIFSTNPGGSLGFHLKDATSTFNAWSFNFTDDQKQILSTTGNDIPSRSLEIALPRLITGWNQYYEINDNISINSEIDLDMTFDGKRNVLIQGKTLCIDPHIGFEGGYKKVFYLRAGIGQFQYYKGSDPTDPKKETIGFTPALGAGIKLKKLSFDYALNNVGSVNAGLYSHVFGLKIQIDKKKK